MEYVRAVDYTFRKERVEKINPTMHNCTSLPAFKRRDEGNFLKIPVKKFNQKHIFFQSEFLMVK